MNSPVGLRDPIQTQMPSVLGNLLKDLTSPTNIRDVSPPPDMKRRVNKPAPTNGNGNNKQKQKGTAGGSAQRTRRANSVAIGVPASKGAISRPLSMQAASRASTLVVSHCEPFQNISLTAAGVLNYTTIGIIPLAFSYLNGLAAQFSKYRWRKLHIYYVPSCPTSTQGEVALGLYDDWADAGAASFVQVATMNKGISFPPWGGGAEFGANSISIDVDVSMFDKPRYNYINAATFNPLSNVDKDAYTPVILATASQGSTAAVTIAGRVWVSYTIELINPIPGAINV